MDVSTIRRLGGLCVQVARWVNFLASLTLYGACGLVWYYRGSLAVFGED